jgi:hypothetical protein
LTTRCPESSYSICTSRPSAEPEEVSVPATTQLDTIVCGKLPESKECYKCLVKKLLQYENESAKYRDQLASAQNQISEVIKQLKELYRQIVRSAPDTGKKSLLST